MHAHQSQLHQNLHSYTRAPKPSEHAREPITAPPKPITATHTPYKTAPKPSEHAREPITAPPKPSECTPKPSEHASEPITATRTPSKTAPKPSERAPKPSERAPKPSEHAPKPSELECQIQFRTLGPINRPLGKIALILFVGIGGICSTVR
jgi:hypothetical protein